MSRGLAMLGRDPRILGLIKRCDLPQISRKPSLMRMHEKRKFSTQFLPEALGYATSLF